MWRNIDIYAILQSRQIIENVIQNATVAMIATSIGFLIARWFYRSEVALRASILQQEIMRLRRRVSEEHRSIESLRRDNRREKRKAKRPVGLDDLGI